eukprot:1416442-Amphidinium_carterae.1
MSGGTLFLCTRHTKALPFEKKPSMSELAAESPNWHPPLHAAYRCASQTDCPLKDLTLRCIDAVSCC